MASFRAPAGTILDGKRVGGKYISPSQLAGATRGGASMFNITSRYSTRIPQINTALYARTWINSRETAEDIARDARALAPYHPEDDAYTDKYGISHPGGLRDSIDVEEIGEQDFAVGTWVPYAAYVEFGTSRQPPEPYLIPAYERNRNAYIEQELAILRSL